MSRESAVTETVSYRVEECAGCGTEVGLGSEIPDGELVEPGYAAVIGEGTVSISDERAGNWSTELEFAGEESDSQPPTVEGHIVCANCAESVHGYSSDNETYRGPLPDTLVSGTGGPELPISEQMLAAIVVGVLLVLLLLAL